MAANRPTNVPGVADSPNVLANLLIFYLLDRRTQISECSFRAYSRPSAIGIKTRAPLHLALKELDIVPRDPVGAALQWTALLISKVAETADVSVDLRAVPRVP